MRELVQQHYQGACSTAARVLESHADPYALPRVDACYLRNAACFRSVFTNGFHTYLATRRFIRRLRGQPEGS